MISGLVSDASHSVSRPELEKIMLKPSYMSSRPYSVVSTRSAVSPAGLKSREKKIVIIARL